MLVVYSRKDEIVHVVPLRSWPIYYIWESASMTDLGLIFHPSSTSRFHRGRVAASTSFGLQKRSTRILQQN